MRKVVLCVCVLYLALASFGCTGPQISDSEKNAPPMLDPHAAGNSAGQPASGPRGSPGGSGGHPGSGGPGGSAGR